MRSLVIAVIVLLNCPLAYADEEFDCKNPPSEMDARYCIGEGFDVSEKKLNATYNKALKCFSAENSPLLKKSELSWLKFRDAETDLESLPNEGAQIYNSDRAAIMREMDKQRIHDLEDIIKNCDDYND